MPMYNREYIGYDLHDQVIQLFNKSHTLSDARK